VIIASKKLYFCNDENHLSFYTEDIGLDTDGSGLFLQICHLSAYIAIVQTRANLLSVRHRCHQNTRAI
jgi:hypothetical protein